MVMVRPEGWAGQVHAFLGGEGLGKDFDFILRALGSHWKALCRGNDLTRFTFYL